MTVVTAATVLPSARTQAVSFRLGLPVVPVALGLAGVLVLRSEQVTSAGSFGLITELPALIWPVWAALVAHFVWGIRRPNPPLMGISLGLLAWTVTLHGAPALLEPATRFGVSWRVAGFVEHLARTGETLPQLDARMSWPGVLAALAGFSQATGIDPVAVARWWPLLVQLLTLLLAAAVLQTCLPDRRSRLVALWLLVPINWVGQDYYSPQSVALLIHLGILAVLLTWFGHRGEVAGPLRRLDRRVLQLARWSGPPGTAVRPTTVAQRALLAVLLLLAAVALAAGHQLTPAMTVTGAAALFLIGRSRLGSYPVLVIALTSAYISYFAVAYWSGHLSDIFGGVGKVGGTVQSSVSGRAVGDLAHRIVVGERIGFSLAIGLLALAGALRALRRRRLDLTLPVLIAAPVLAVGLQSYGGEVMLRVFVFAAVPMAGCVALLLVPSGSALRLSRRATAALVVVSVLAVPAFLVARYGNEAYEMVPPGEVAVAEHLYATARPGAALVVYGGAGAYRHRDIEKYAYADARSLIDAGEYDDLADGLLGNAAGGWLLVTESAQLYGVAVGLLAPDWRKEATSDLLSSGRFRIEMSNDDATLFAPVRRTP